ncbi:MAG: cupin domain-containing protein [Rhodoferax sp.]|nr:cupin domain-containing protein [Rhodoferax sp.]
MQVDQSLPLLGGLSPAQFMKRYWHKKPLLIRQAIPDMQAFLSRGALFDLAARDDVQSRLVIQQAASAKQPWRLRHGPFARRSLPPLKQPGWTLLVQSVDLIDARIHALREQFRFVPDARLDDVMVSYASDGGGVGPHFDSYDVFLLQAQGHRRWRIGRQKNLALQEGMPLKILADFQPEEEFVLEPGDMLYLPPRYAHDGAAQGECMTYSIGFRAPDQVELAQALLQGMAEQLAESIPSKRYRDPGQSASDCPAQIPLELQAFAQDALSKALRDPDLLARTLGEHLSEPAAAVWFQPQESACGLQHGVRLDRGTRMLYHARHIFINGESFEASGRDAQLVRQLADLHFLDIRDCARLSPGAAQLLGQWLDSGWLQELK